MKSSIILALTLIGVLFFIHKSSAQIACAASAANYLVDYGFEVGSTYCRNSSVELDVDDITLCVIGYDGKNLTYDLGSSTQTNLQTNFAPPPSGGWTSTGEVDVITGNYQTVHGFWAVKLNGQFAPGSISQSFTVNQNDPQCNAQFYSSTNNHAPSGFQANYSMIISKGNTVVSTQNFLGNPNNPTGGAPLYTTTSPYVTLPGAGVYTLTFVSNDVTPVAFSDGLYPTQTYFGRTGIVIDDICFSCLVTPSPSVSPSSSSPPSASSTPAVSPSPSPSATPAPSVVPAPSCPAFIHDDEENWEWVPHREDDEDTRDTTTINVYFADILNGGRRW